MYKNFKVTERVGLQFRMEFYNLLNKTQFRADQNNFQLAGSAVACNADNIGVRFENVKVGDVVYTNQPYTTACYQHAINSVGYTFSGFVDPVNSQRDPAVQNSSIPAMGQGSFGRITKDRGPREIQYALKITF